MMVDVFTRSGKPSLDGSSLVLWLVLRKDPDRHGNQPLSCCCCEPGVRSGVPRRIIAIKETELISGKPLPWKWKHIYIAPRPVYRTESRLETQNLISRLGPGLGVPTPPFFISASTLDNSRFKLVYATPLVSELWTGSPPLTLIYDSTIPGFRHWMSLTLGWCDAAACIGSSANVAGSKPSPHFAHVRFHERGEDLDSLAANLSGADGTHAWDDHVLHWVRLRRGFPIPTRSSVAYYVVVLSFRHRMPQAPCTTLELLHVRLEQW